jgi:hypothetical protein
MGIIITKSMRTHFVLHPKHDHSKANIQHDGNPLSCKEQIKLALSVTKIA